METSVNIYIDNRVIAAIRKHIVPCQRFAGGNVAVGVQKSAGFGIVIARCQVVVTRFRVVDIAPVTERIFGTEGGCQGTGDGDEFAPRIVGVAYDLRSLTVVNDDHITLQVAQVVILCSGVGHGARNAICGVGEVERG